MKKIITKFNEGLSDAIVWAGSKNQWQNKKTTSFLLMDCHLNPFTKFGATYFLFLLLGVGFRFRTELKTDAGLIVMSLLVSTGIYALLAPPLLQIMHYLLPSRQERHTLIIKKLESDIIILDLPLNAINLELFKTDIKSFCLEYFGKNGPGFINFIKERTEDDKLFLNYALSIPKAKEMSVDSLRKVLSGYSSYLEFGSVLDLESAFRDYTPEEIERAFCGIGWKMDMFTKTIPPLIKNNKALPVVRNLKLLNDIAVKKIPIWLQGVKGEQEGFKFQVLENRNEYQNASDVMGNCIRTKVGKNSYIILVTCLEDDYVTAVEVSPSKNITQMAGSGDIISKHRNQIGRILTKKGMKVVCSLPHMF